MSGLSFAREGADWPNREASRFVEAGGYRWHVQEMGQGPVALLVHGTAGATHTWRGLAPLLAPDFRVISMDLPGHGFTTSRRPPDLSLPGMSKALVSLRAHLVAKDELQPELFVAINGAFLPFEGWAGRVFPAMAKLLRFNPFAARLFAWSADKTTVANMLNGMGSKLDARGVDLYARLMRSPAHCGGALGMMSSWNLRDMPADVARVACPALLIVGANDRAVSPKEAPRIARLMPQATVESLPGVGHLAHEEKPERVAGRIRAAAVAAGILGA